MKSYNYTPNTGSLKKFFEKIPSLGIPQRVTSKYLYSLGFKSTNDRTIIAILKSLKFLDDNGMATEKYKKYRDKNSSKVVLGTAIQDTYSEIFKIYPNAPELGNSDLDNFFRTHTGLGEKAVKSLTNTFKTLCSIATFDKLDVAQEVMEETNIENPPSKSFLHTLDLTLKEGRRARIIVPHDIDQGEIEKLKKLLDVLK